MRKGKSWQSHLVKSHNPAKEARREDRVTDGEEVQEESIFSRRQTCSTPRATQPQRGLFLVARKVLNCQPLVLGEIL